MALDFLLRGRGCYNCADGEFSTFAYPEELKTMATATAQAPQRVSCDEALRIARLDAERAYRDLTPFRIELSLEQDGWHIDYRLSNPRLNGGGPHYVIDAHSGNILSKRYEQ